MREYTVFSVLGDGNQFNVLTTWDPRAALAKLKAEQEKYAGHRHHAHGIYDADDPEAGDLELRLEELLVEELPEAEARRDADNDAETLLRILPNFPPQPDYYGEIARLRIGRGSARGHDSAYRWARMAARAAFAVVPALKGER